MKALDRVVYKNNHLKQIQYVVIAKSGKDICIIQEFEFSEWPYKRQLLIWQPKRLFKKVKQ